MGTAQSANRDKGARPLKADWEPAVSGSLAQSRTPKTPRNRVFFSIEHLMGAGSLRSARLNGGEGVEGELVSVSNFLITRENTGKFSDFGLR